MKTFLWTTLFWILVVIAGLLCLGFGNLGTQVVENGWVASIMPKNLQTRVCEPVIAATMESIDWCAAAEAKDCAPAAKEGEIESLTGETARLQEPLSSIIANQEIIYNYLQTSFASMNQSIAELQNAAGGQVLQNHLIDEKQQQRIELQAQIDALQAQMASL